MMLNTLNLVRLAKTLLVAATMVVSGPVHAGQTTSTKKPDGGSTITITKREGSECSLFNPQGTLQCSRSIAETNHTAAVAKCLKMKC
jgi:hypothetical protein